MDVYVVEATIQPVNRPSKILGIFSDPSQARESCRVSWCKLGELTFRKVRDAPMVEVIFNHTQNVVATITTYEVLCRVEHI